MMLTTIRPHITTPTAWAGYTEVPNMSSYRPSFTGALAGSFGGIGNLQPVVGSLWTAQNKKPTREKIHRSPEGDTFAHNEIQHMIEDPVDWSVKMEWTVLTRKGHERPPKYLRPIMRSNHPLLNDGINSIAQAANHHPAALLMLTHFALEGNIVAEELLDSIDATTLQAYASDERAVEAITIMHFVLGKEAAASLVRIEGIEEPPEYRALREFAHEVGKGIGELIGQR